MSISSGPFCLLQIGGHAQRRMPATPLFIDSPIRHHHLPDGMYFLAQITTAVIILNLLQKIGIPRDRLEFVVRNCNPFRWITEQGSELFPQLFPRD